jgi:hypothetical protein
VTKTARVEELLREIETQGYWTAEQVWEIHEMTGRDPLYLPEGTEDWMAEDGVPRAYDRPKNVAPVAHTYELPTDDEMPPRDSKLDPPPQRPAEAKELAKSGLVTMGADGIAVPVEIDARLKTIEATLTDVMRRLKALEDKLV